MFVNRWEAGKELAKRLHKFKGKDCVVLAIPRGGVIVADSVCRSLGADMGLIITRKLSAPRDPEMAIGAVAPDGTTVLDDEFIRNLFVSKDYIQKEKEKQVKEIERRIKEYHADMLAQKVSGRTIIIVDDGMATGFTIICAIKYLRKKRAKRIIVATPVAPMETVKRIKESADDVVVLNTPVPFYAIGHFYQDFEQVSDKEVLSIVKKYLKKKPGRFSTIF